MVFEITLWFKKYLLRRNINDSSLFPSNKPYNKEGDPNFKFKDVKGRIKPQAARFRIYGYRNDQIVGEIRPGDGVEIQWTVELANKKAAHMGFFGIKNQDQKGPIRNAGT